MNLFRRPKVVVRDATVADARGIAEVLVDSWLAAYEDLMPAELLAGISVGERHKQLATALAAPTPPGAVRLVAELQGVIVGFANAGVPNTDNPAADAGARRAVTAPATVDSDGEGSDGDGDAQGPGPRRIGELAVLYVSSLHWREGIGRKLTRVAIKRLLASGCDEVRAWVVDGNEPAFTFFQRQGWTRSAVQRREIMDGHLIYQTRVDFRLVD
ncbi:GNAT family N-acetyltransferase [Demequina aurantiaca]|uniref:GNAT family N-acetyltransferase n=1 Tax=Demequina aurantiaca TaxID=676200 RepID=UPI000A61B066|nr:GNAT family N-acetyltransferase [Demequina aurantiaca]